MLNKEKQTSSNSSTCQALKLSGKESVDYSILLNAPVLHWRPVVSIGDNGWIPA